MFNFLLILLKSAIPIAATSFGLVWWALRQDYLGGASSLDEYEQWKKAEDQDRKEQKKLRKQAKRNPLPAAVDEDSVAEDLQPEKRKFDALHSKWMQFGGGFYGVVAFYTYLLIELAEIRDFLLNLSDLFHTGLISLLVSFLVDSMLNFVTAIAWPAYWLSHIHSEQWLWVIGAYGGYWLGARAAFRFRQRHTD